jgi:hypothetical protein
MVKIEKAEKTIAFAIDGDDLDAIESLLEAERALAEARQAIQKRCTDLIRKMCQAPEDWGYSSIGPQPGRLLTGHFTHPRYGRGEW